ncbi:kinetochore-associated protein DSN1 homolog isoform X1 [Podarcis lilfordi]|uniref:Kinetochore-associated protein DSN1 homolog isoform X1 n=1 Tax=Podarcis lilfordi TaxID=74358 RepID=A0AA35NXT3_9SAUR|nr:kinetochore-associated protein DSN1 homolog isoform X1 [Podarcis lilfordi]
MAAAAPRPGSTEDSLPKDITQQNSSKENQPGFEDRKNVATLENVCSQEKTKAGCASEPDNIRFSCGIQSDPGASHTQVLAEIGKRKCNLSPGPNEGDAHGPSPKKGPLQNLGPGSGQASTSFNQSFGHLPNPRVMRHSLNRYSLKLGTNRRKSLPPLHMDVSELSKAISLDLPETDRMVELLHSSFRYSARKLECSLKQTEGFDPETFEQKVNLLSEDLNHCTKKLKLDGTLQKCLEDSQGGLADPVLNSMVAALKETTVRFSAEDQAWEELLLSYQKNAEDISRQLQEYKLKQVPEEPYSYTGASQAHVLQAKPDYQNILDSQGEVFDYMELVLDEVHQMVKVCQSYIEDVTRYLQKLSVQLASGTFQNLENSPARKLLRLPPTTPSVIQPPEG